MWVIRLPASVGATTIKADEKTTKRGTPIIVPLTTDGKASNTPTFTRIKYFREISFSNLNIL
jgi:hypothetical protein